MSQIFFSGCARRAEKGRCARKVWGDSDGMWVSRRNFMVLRALME